MNRLSIKLLSKMLNVKPYLVNPCIKKFWNDLTNEKRTNLKQKLWAYKRGFISSRIIEYSLSEENYKKYISDLAYYRLYPINNEYSKWIDDKLTTKYVLSKYNQYLPQYYYYIKQGMFLPLIDAPSQVNLSSDSIVELLKSRGCLAIKRETGTKGTGFYKVEYEKNIIYLNEGIINENEFKCLINSLDGYLVTEFSKAHKILNDIYPKTSNTLRLSVIKDGSNPSLLANASINFGTSETKGADNLAKGGLISIIDIRKGSFKTAYKFIDGSLVSYALHPDTGVPIDAILPNWNSVVEKVLEISDYLGQLSWMGFDVVLTSDGLKILEINSHEDIEWYQYFYPLLEDNAASEFLKKKLKEQLVKQ